MLNSYITDNFDLTLCQSNIYTFMHNYSRYPYTYVDNVL